MTAITMENINIREDNRKKTSKPLLWICIVSIIMFFSGLTSAVVVSQGGGGFIDIELPTAFLISTIIIIVSSAVFHFGLNAIKNGKMGIAKISVSITLILGFYSSPLNLWVGRNCTKMVFMLLVVKVRNRALICIY